MNPLGLYDWKVCNIAVNDLFFRVEQFEEWAISRENKMCLRLLYQTLLYICSSCGSWAMLQIVWKRKFIVQLSLSQEVPSIMLLFKLRHCIEIMLKIIIVYKTMKIDLFDRSTNEDRPLFRDRKIFSPLLESEIISPFIKGPWPDHFFDHPNYLNFFEILVPIDGSYFCHSHPEIWRSKFGYLWRNDKKRVK